MAYSTAQRLGAEALGAALLLAIVVGSSIMGDALSGGNDAIALIGNTAATGAGLYVLITIFGPVSGAHFNPAVTLAFLIRKEITAPMAGAYVAVQTVSAIAGVLLAHAMFDLDLLQISTNERAGVSQSISEGVAAFGLVLTILGAIRFRAESVAAAVGLYITAGYWFTASTSFANPAVTIARMLTDSFAGIRPIDAPAFIIAQLIGAVIAVIIAHWLFTARDSAQ